MINIVSNVFIKTSNSTNINNIDYNYIKEQFNKLLQNNAEKLNGYELDQHVDNPKINDEGLSVIMNSTNSDSIKDKIKNKEIKIHEIAFMTHQEIHTILQI